MKLLWVESLKLARICMEVAKNNNNNNNNNNILNVLEVWYEFNEPFDPYVEACTSFYEFSGTKKLAGWVGYWTPTTLVCPLPINGCPHPHTIRLNTLSSTSVRLSLVQFALCGEHRSYF